MCLISPIGWKATFWMILRFCVFLFATFTGSESYEIEGNEERVKLNDWVKMG